MLPASSDCILIWVQSIAPTTDRKREMKKKNYIFFLDLVLPMFLAFEYRFARLAMAWLTIQTLKHQYISKERNHMKKKSLTKSQTISYPAQNRRIQPFISWFF